MPKYNLLFFFLLFVYNFFAQTEYPRIEKIEVNQKIYNGSIANYPITLYLKYHSPSDYGRGIYAIKGWYYYNNIQKKIPLVGLSYGGQLYLYHFEQPNIANELLTFKTLKNSRREAIAYYKNLEGFTEKFIIEATKSEWHHKDKVLPLNMTYDGSLLSFKEYLRLNKSESIDLHNIAPTSRNYELVAVSNNRYLLHFEFVSGSNPVGLCGAGLEAGYLNLELNADNALHSFSYHLYESCFSGLYSNLKPKTQKNIKIYHCIDGNNNSNYELIIDLDQAKVVKK